MLAIRPIAVPSPTGAQRLKRVEARRPRATRGLVAAMTTTPVAEKMLVAVRCRTWLYRLSRVSRRRHACALQLEFYITVLVPGSSPW